MNNYKINPLGIASQGFTNFNSLSIAMQGFLIKITEEIVEVSVKTPNEIKKSGVGYRKRENVYIKEKRKKITVTVIKDNKEFKKSVYYKNLKITPNDINVEFNENDKPKIKISLK
jgi:hypothetical protein